MIRRYASLLVLAALLALLAPPATAVAHEGEQQENWHINDDPRVDGHWWQRHSSLAQGGEYWVTHGIDRHDWEARAVWEMGHKHGRQQVWVYIPRSDDVQATVNYRVYANGNRVLAGGRVSLWDVTGDIRQRHHKGWQKIGEYKFDGADVRIEVWDNETDQTYSQHGADASRFAVDAVAMRCVSRCEVDYADPADAWRQQSNRLALQECLNDGITRLAENLNHLASALDADYAVGTVKSAASLIPVLGVGLGLGDVWTYGEDSGEDPFADIIQEIASTLRSRYFDCPIW